MSVVVVAEKQAGASSVMRKSIALLAVGLLSFFATSCMDQYHPEPYWAQFAQEREQASRPTPKLTEKGELPTAGAVVPADQRFAQLCASCHGNSGDGNGPAGQALNPKPRNFTDAAWHSSVDDGRIHKVIKEGGASVGLAPIMAGFGSQLSDSEIDALVAYIRQFKK